MDLPRSGRDSAAPLTPAEYIAQVTAVHDAVTARWLAYELDVGKRIERPELSDGRHPLTAAFLRAKREADLLRPGPRVRWMPWAELVAYREAVDAYARAFAAAERPGADSHEAGDGPDSPTPSPDLPTAPGTRAGRVIRARRRA
ncbi:hypothetical protein M4I32_05680 [Microbacterium sp. LRZ72]|uniref:hypothetical protein n=1 Tax=Microbacterium sp. LRZ72 TaxID=2942481 RepID=UPI0029B81196|nr:hypothetical protein [Microbacterium sp. LRZ72]MDX2376287.1 hypothetical protein [Microbacterium sp. LRZ72]